MHKNILLFLYLIILFLPLGSKAESGIDHKIAVLVNEEIITSYDIIQRLKLEAIIQNININEQNNQVLFNNAVDDLIYEKLKFEKINEYKIKADDNEYLEFESNFFERNKIDKNLIVKLFDQNNINYSDLERRLASELLWNKLIGALYYRLTSVSELEIDEISKKNPLISYEQAQNLVIQRQLDLQSSKLLRDMMNEATIEYR
jgi:peptidyl-prolyl cis-trans isomerase SurA